MVISYTKANEEVVTETVLTYTKGTGNYYHLLYASPTTPTKYSVWFYELITNAYPNINNNILFRNFNDYYPSIIIRKNKVNTFDSGTNYEKEANKILRFMGADLEKITESHLIVIKANNGKKLFLPYLERLEKAREVIEVNTINKEI